MEAILTSNPDHARNLQTQGIAVIGVCVDENYSPWEGVRYLTDSYEVSRDYQRLVEARFSGTAFEVLRTKRCIVRETVEEDHPDFCRIYEDAEVVRFMEPLYPYEEEEAYIRDYRRNVYEFFEYGMWTVLERSSGRVIGRAGLEPRGESAHLGYVLDASCRRQGIATEVCSAILAYAKVNFPELLIEASADKENTASVRLLKSLGFCYAPEKDLYQLVQA